jgi:hypothetical protein
VNGGHETLGDAPVVVDDLGHRGEAVRGAGGIGDIGEVGLVLGVVDTHDEDGSVVLGRSRHDDLLSAALGVSLRLLLGQVNTGALSDVLSADRAPLDLARILLLEDLDGLPVDLDAALDSLNIALEAPY